MSQKHFLTLFIGVIVLITLGPLLFMFLKTFSDIALQGMNTHMHLWQSTNMLHSMQNSLSLAGTVAFIVTLTGTLLAIVLFRTPLPFKYMWVLLLFLPLLVPPYIIAYGWYLLVGRDAWLFGFWGCTLVLAGVFLPVAVLIIGLYMQKIDPLLEDVALLLCSPRCVLRYITLPLIKPAMLLSFVLVFILSILEVSVANFLRYDIFPLKSFTAFSAFYDYQSATLLALPLVFIVIAGLALWYKLLPQKTHTFTVGNTRPFPAAIPLFLSVVLLGAVLALTTLLPLWGIIGHTDMPHFVQALTQSAPALKHSLLYAASGATLLSLLGFFSAYILTYRHVYGSTLLEMTLLLGFVLSSVVIGIALILFWNHSWIRFIYATPAIILLGYGVKYLFLTTKFTQLGFTTIPSTLLEAAEISGASWVQIVRFILLPLSRWTLFGSWIIAFIFALRETTLTMLVAPAGTSTLPIYIFTRMANGSTAFIAALCLILIGTVVVTASVAMVLFHYKEKHT